MGAAPYPRRDAGFAALARSGEAGDAGQLRAEYDAARAYARILVRTGLIGAYMAKPSKLEAMLYDARPAFNFAAIEAFRLSISWPIRRRKVV